jgi:CBS domain-containing protein
MVKDKKIFLGYIANLAIKNMPPIGFLKTFVVEKSGEHKDKLNLKVKGLGPLVDIVRLFSLEKGIKETSTIERIGTLRDKHTIMKEYADELIHAFEFIMLLRIQHQFEQMKEGKDINNFIDPNALSNLEKRIAKETFQLISKLQDSIIERYKAMIW